ncbi:MAG: adenylyltransferase/cytidyltransferase family protein [Planctomycetota bacterium]
MTDPHQKVMSLADLAALRQKLHSEGRSVILTNGCFDILHRGHVEYLWSSSQAGDFLMVAINSDRSVRLLKGETRPINSDHDRALLVASLGFVGATFVFAGPRLDDEIRTLRPDIYTKAGDYTVDSLDPDERQALVETGCDIRIMSFCESYSTTSIVKRMAPEMTKTTR